MAITRDSLQSGHLLDLVRASDGVEDLGDLKDIREAMQAFLATRKTGGDVWVFAYGSLLWNPAFHFDDSRLGQLYGYHRRFCLWSIIGRGSPQHPGLVLALDRGGSCHGLLYRIRQVDIETELELIWRREMITFSYRPRWVNVHCQGERLEALAFLVKRDHRSYAGSLSAEKTAQILATAEGFLGPAADYLDNTVAHLEQLGIPDQTLHRLKHRVDQLRGS